MELKVLGSSSKGNCYILDNGKEALVLEAGVPFSKVKQEMKGEIGRIKACLVSHEHGDHAKYLGQVLEARIDVMMPDAMAEAWKKYRGLVHEAGIESFGGFKVMAFANNHDVPCVGYMVHHPDMGTLVFATDTKFVSYKFSNVRTYMIEANYSMYLLKENLENGKVQMNQYKRVVDSHMGIHTAREMLEANDLSKTSNIVLLHLSDGNSDERAFREEIYGVVPEFVGVHIANEGLKICL